MNRQIRSRSAGALIMHPVLSFGCAPKHFDVPFINAARVPYEGSSSCLFCHHLFRNSCIAAEFLRRPVSSLGPFLSSFLSLFVLLATHIHGLFLESASPLLADRSRVIFFSMANKTESASSPQNTLQRGKACLRCRSVFLYPFTAPC